MRAGAHWRADSIEELEPLCETLDRFGASAIHAPHGYAAWSEDQCIAFGEKARSLGLVIGEAGYWENLLGANDDALASHIKQLRRMARNGDCMGVHCLVTLAGSFDTTQGPASIHPDNYTQKARERFREICLRIVDGLDLHTLRYAPEPWHNSFYHQVNEIKAFLDSLSDTRIAFHLDQANLVTQFSYMHTTELIRQTFQTLGDRIVSVHAKDLCWNACRMFLHIDEVYPGDGALDYDEFMRQLAKQDINLPVFVEHFTAPEQFETAVVKLHEAAKRAGVQFTARRG